MLAIRRIDPLGFYLLPAGQPVDDGNNTSPVRLRLAID